MGQADAKGVTLHSDHHVVRMPDRFEPMLATEEECMTWLNRYATDAAKDGSQLTSRMLGVTMFLTTGHGGPYEATTLRWVDSLSCKPAPITPP